MKPKHLVIAIAIVGGVTGIIGGVTLSIMLADWLLPPAVRPPAPPPMQPQDNLVVDANEAPKNDPPKNDQATWGRPTPENFEQLEVGMNREQAEAIMGPNWTAPNPYAGMTVPIGAGRSVFQEGAAMSPQTLWDRGGDIQWGAPKGPDFTVTVTLGRISAKHAWPSPMKKGR
jgi:hypothetical protein